MYIVLITAIYPAQPCFSYWIAVSRSISLYRCNFNSINFLLFRYVVWLSSVMFATLIVRYMAKKSLNRIQSFIFFLAFPISTRNQLPRVMLIIDAFPIYMSQEQLNRPFPAPYASDILSSFRNWHFVETMKFVSTRVVIKYLAFPCISPWFHLDFVVKLFESWTLLKTC